MGTGVFFEKWGSIPHQDGRVTDNDEVVSGFYTAGWIKRGPSGLIGTNKPDSVKTVESLLQDRESLLTADVSDSEALRQLLDQRGIRVINFEDWKRIDAAELEMGASRGKTREKFTRRKEMLDVLGDTASV